MSYSHDSFRSSRNGNRHTATIPSPLRHASTVSASSDDCNTSPTVGHAYTSTPTTTSFESIPSAVSSHKRGIVETSPTRTSAVPDYHYTHDAKSSPPRTRRGREGLRTLDQAPNVVIPPPISSSLPDSRETSPERLDMSRSTYSQTNSSDYSAGIGRSNSRRAGVYDQSRSDHGDFSPNSSLSLLDENDYKTLGRSATKHMRTLSKFAESGSDTDFALTSPEKEVAGLHGRIRLQRNGSQRANKAQSGPGYGGRTWMDQERQYLQAYEYLCHIGEAKEWIEDVMHEKIPPIVQLEETLRDGVTLAEIVQALRPEKRLKIFRNAKLQFRHSDNIAIFFRFLDEVELPDLFRFELVDLYEKKNIPKVIYCIHALSWVLLRLGLVDFRMGNLVGHLQFENHELEATQRGLDKAGISMPNFSGMGANFGAEPEPEPEPQETEEERIERELLDCEPGILDLQAQIRASLVRTRLGAIMSQLWDSEHLIVQLQSRVRGDFARQISSYRLDMQRFATDLQGACRGFLVRARERRKESTWKASEKDIIRLQSMFRARQVRQQTRAVKSEAQNHHTGIAEVQAAIRGALCRWQVTDQLVAFEEEEPSIAALQSVIRGVLQRKQYSGQIKATRQAHAQEKVKLLQAAVRGMQRRAAINTTTLDVSKHHREVVKLQAHIRASLVRQRLDELLGELDEHVGAIIELQSTARAYISRKNVQQLKQRLSYHSTSVVALQSASRGFTARQDICDLLTRFQPHEKALTDLQAILRAMLVRASLTDVIDALDSEQEVIVDLQAAARGMLVRAKFAAKKRYFEENMKKVIKVQSYIRARQQGEAYKSLTQGKNPPVSTVKSFVHLLNDSDFDFDEEVESEKLRKTVGQRVRENEQTEQWIAELDAKIGLLAQNKIARDEYVRIQRHYGAQATSRMANRASSLKDTFNLKALNRSSRMKLELYQEVFFLLQTQPQIFARLSRKVREGGATEEDFKRLEMLVISTYGFAQKRREEFYLLKLIARCIQEDADACESLPEFNRGSFFFNRLFNNYTRAPKDRKFVRDLLCPFVKSQIVEQEHLDLESDPLQIYRNIVNDEELRTGRRGVRNLDISREQAIKDSSVRPTFIRHLQDLRDVVDAFLDALEVEVRKMPFGARYLTQAMFDILRERFPREDEHEIAHVVGSWLWRMYLKPAILEPETYGVVDRGLSTAQKKNLNEFSKVVTQAMAGRRFGEENVYLQPLNTYVEEAVGRIEAILANIMEVEEPEVKFDMDEFNDLYAKVKPTLHIKMADVFAIHQLIALHLPQLCVSHEENGLREVIGELGNPKSNEAEMSAGASEVTLSLSTKQHQIEDPDAGVKTLFMETKRCVLYIIRVQAGTNLMDVMVKHVSDVDEEKWESIVREELSEGSRKRGAYSEANNLMDIASMSYADLKSVTLENIIKLERLGRLSRANYYQDLLNEIATDIRQKHRRRIERQRELEAVRGTLVNLDEKSTYLEDKLKAYNDTFEQNLNVLQNKKGKRRFLMPFSKQYNHERELARSGRLPTYGSYKYSAETLAEKGILIEWKNRSLREIDIIISSDEVNIFVIEATAGSIVIPGASATFTWDDMLEAQYQGHTVLRFFGGEAKAGSTGSRVGSNPMVLDAKLFMQQVSKKFWPE